MIINKERQDFESKQIIKLPESEWVYVKNAFPPIVTEEEWEQTCYPDTYTGVFLSGLSDL